MKNYSSSYLVIYALDTYELEQKVLILTDQHYTPVGGICIQKQEGYLVNESQRFIFYQAMFKPDTTPWYKKLFKNLSK
jgi:hypothetical protein